MKEEKTIIIDYLNYLKLKNYKPRGIEEKLRIADYFLTYAQENEINIYKVGIKEAENYREYLRLLTDKNGMTRYNPKTINVMIAHLRGFYAFLISVNMSLRNPFLNIEKMKESYTMPKNILTIEQMKILLTGIEVNEKSDLKFKTIVELLYSTGARINEIESLTIDNLNLNTGYITIYDDKERQNRKAVLTEYSKELLKLYMKYVYSKDSELIFYHGAKRSLNRWINDRLKRLCKKLKLPVITCHGIRHTTATHLFKNGADIREVQEYLGHRRIKNTEIYTHIFPDDLKEVVEKNHPREKRLTK